MYPADWPSNRWLEFYARYFPAVEIDSTFYSAPSEAIARRWVEMTPAHFRFACKLPREITHQRRLRDCRAELTAFLQRARAARAEAARRPDSTAAFLRAEGRENRPFGISSRSCRRIFVSRSNFATPAGIGRTSFGCLEKHRLCWVWSDMSPLNERNQAPFEFQPITTDFLYLRLLGDALTKYDGSGQRIHRYGKLLWKREAALDSWALAHSAAPR